VSRWWTEHTADLFDAIGAFFSALGNLLATLFGLVPWAYVLLGLLGVFVLWILYRIVASLRGRPKRARKAKKQKRKRAKAVDEPEGSDEAAAAQPDQVPELPAVVFASLADRYAAEGRFAEAIRERLRAMVRRMVEVGVIANRPGATVTELAAEAANARPAVGPAVHEASRIFSDVWYGERQATAAHDNRMRELGASVEQLTTVMEMRTG
jgi:hypothetical protein